MENNHRLIQVQNLLQELVCRESHGLGGDAADVVERQASVQSFLHAIFLVHEFQGLGQ